MARSTFLGSMTLYGTLSAGQTGEGERWGEVVRREEEEDAPVVLCWSTGPQVLHQQARPANIG